MQFWDRLRRMLGLDAEKQGETLEDGGIAIADDPASPSQPARPSSRSQPGEDDENHDFEPPPPDAWWIQRSTNVVDLRSDGDMVDRDLYDHLIRVLNDPDLELPRLSGAAQRALGMLNDPSVDCAKLADVLGRDPSAATELLRVANSAAYRGIREVTRLDLACARMGRRALESIVLALTTKNLLVHKGGQRSLGQELWERAIASGAVMAAMSKRLKFPEDDAFLVGLLHDIGSIAILRVVHDYEETHGRVVSNKTFDQICSEWHEHLGLRLADTWNLPTPLPDLIGSHHREPSDDDPLIRWRWGLQWTDRVVGMLGYGPQQGGNLFAERCSRQLGLADDRETRPYLLSLPQKVKDRLASF